MNNDQNTGYAALLLRLSLGVMFLAHGMMKFFIFTPAGTVKYFESIGYPGFFAYIVILAEIGGGLTLTLGVWTRVIALLLLPLMIGATMEHSGNGWLFSVPGGGWEFPVFWTLTLVVQSLLGSGPYALKLFGRQSEARVQHVTV